MNTPKYHTVRKLTAGTLIVSLLFPVSVIQAYSAPLTLSQVPLFATTAAKANVLLTLDDSNSMDEDATGSAAGSANANSKSEIARTVAKNIISTYTNKINMGLMSYQQSGVVPQYLHNSPYDASFNPANYNSAFTGVRESLTKKYRTPNPTDTGKYIYYNVALPFYASSNQGSGFCYSNTAIAFNSPPAPDTYRCYSSKTGTSDSLPGMDGTGASAAGYSSYKYTSSFFPTDSDIAQNISDFGRFLTWNYVSPTWFSNTSPGKGYLHIPIKQLDATQAGYLNTKLGTSQFTTNAPTNRAYPLQNAGLTPIEGTLQTTQSYFSNTLSDTAQGYSSSGTYQTYPLPTSCGKNFNVLITDGLPSTRADGTDIADASTALSQAATAAKNLKDAGVKTYLVGFALPYGTDPTTLDTVAAAGGTDRAYAATDVTTLNSTLADIFSDILAQTGSAAAVATNSTALNASSAIYQAKFDSSNWSGQLLRYGVSASGVVSSTPAWLAGSAVDPVPAYYVPLPGYDTRAIITYKPSNAHGIPFRWPVDSAAPTATELDSSQSTALGNSGMLNYLRGDGSNEGTGASNYRIRANGKLGDIVNSTPIYVGVPSSGYPDNLEASSYSSFKSANSSRTPMIYVGANDGMLHVFEASTGVEKLAYIPSAVYSSLTQLSSKTYSHRYYVDGSPTVADVYFGGAWHTVLVGGLNGGGQAIYALDITNPATFSEAGASSTALWEFNDKDNTATATITDGDADLGYTYSQPVITKMHNGKWVAIFGNGYNNTTADGSASSTGTAALYIVDIQNGNLLAKLDTKAGSAATPNGLASPAAVDVNGDNVAEYIYAGDLLGNMWKFDVTDSSASNWKVAFGTSAAPVPLYVAKDSSGTVQPITSRPEVSLHPTNADSYMVYFGTGKYIETGDNVTTGTQTQTFYGIWDNGSAITTGRTNLLQQSILEERTISGSDYRLTSANSISCWGTTTGCNIGWYMDLYNTFGGATANNGEKQVSNPIYRNGRIIFTTLTPSASACSGGGFSWLMELDPKDGSQLDTTPFDVDKNGSFSSTDFVTGGAYGSATRAVSGTKLGDGIAGTPTLINETAEKQHKYTSQSTGFLKETTESAGARAGRISWRELRD